MIRKWIELSKIVSVMMQYSLLDRRPEETCLDLLADKNIGVLARGSIAQGLLVDKPAKAYLDYKEEEVNKMAIAVKSISDKSTAQTAIQYVLSHRAVNSAVVGIRTLEQLQEIVKDFDNSVLTPDELQTLKEVLPAKVYKEHR